MKHWYDILLEVRVLEECPPILDIEKCELWQLPGACLRCTKDYYRGLASKYNEEEMVRQIIGFRKYEELRREKDRRKHKRVKLKG